SRTGSMAPDQVRPTPSRGRSMEPAKTGHVELFIHREIIDLPLKNDVEARAAGSATKLADHRANRADQALDIVTDLGRDRDGDGVRRAEAVPKRGGHRTRRQRLRIEFDLLRQDELLLESHMQNIAARRAGRMAEPIGDAAQTRLQTGEIIGDFGRHGQAYRSTMSCQSDWRRGHA